MVYERDGTVRGWLMEVRRAGVALILTTVHPDEESISTALVDYALSRAEGVTRISWLVPEYHLLLGRVVERCGRDRDGQVHDLHPVYRRHRKRQREAAGGDLGATIG